MNTTPKTDTLRVDSHPTPDPESHRSPVDASTAPQTHRAAHSAPEAATTKPVQRNEALPVNAIRHPACGDWWTGLSRSHCPSCHRTFSTDSAADKHRIGKHGTDRRCADPASVGLVAREKPYGLLWGFPGPDGGYAALHANGDAR